MPQYFPYLIILAPLAVSMHCAQCVAAAKCCEKSKSDMLGDRGLRYGVAFIFCTLAVIWQHKATVYIRDHIAEIGYCPTDSMAPNIVRGDLYLVLRNYPFGRWNVVTLNNPLADLPPQLAKRVVGMPGDEVEITGDGLEINGQLVEIPRDVDAYIPVDRRNHLMVGPDPSSAAVGCWGRPIHLGPGEYFFLGDNSPESVDSRFFPAIEGHQLGAVPADQITGRVMVILWPPSNWRKFF
jgi:signal peptidase I